jgi:hypothetical protein
MKNSVIQCSFLKRCVVVELELEAACVKLILVYKLKQRGTHLNFLQIGVSIYAFSV